MNLIDLIFESGVVGAGGGGFPTHVKAKSKAYIILANGAECEPLLHKDFELMKNFPEQIVEGMKLMKNCVEAQIGYFGIKSKNYEAIEAIEPFLKNTNIKITELGDFYPSGDEYELVYHATKRLIPPGGIPLQVGCVVNNVETFYNIFYASQKINVTEKFLSIAGAVKNPFSTFVPIGTQFSELIKLAGGTTVKDYGLFVSGIMMGKLTFDESDCVTKTTAGIIVLPKNHYLIQRMSRNDSQMHKIGKSACDQCSYCTEFCPRYLLGYNVQPHKVMRSLGFSFAGETMWNNYAELCCSCGLCTLYSCPEDLYPKEACDKSKQTMRAMGKKYIQDYPPKVHPMKEARRVPLKALMKKLNILDYDSKTPYKKIDLDLREVKIKLKQHAGEKALPIVKKGNRVKKGELIAAPPQGKLGASIHASIEGEIKEINDEFILISR